MLSARHKLRRRYFLKDAQLSSIVPNFVFFLEKFQADRFWQRFIQPVKTRSDWNFYNLKLESKTGADHPKLGIIRLIRIFDAVVIGNIEGDRA